MLVWLPARSVAVAVTVKVPVPSLLPPDVLTVHGAASPDNASAAVQVGVGGWPCWYVPSSVTPSMVTVGGVLSRFTVADAVDVLPARSATVPVAT